MREREAQAMLAQGFFIPQRRIWSEHGLGVSEVEGRLIISAYGGCAIQ